MIFHGGLLLPLSVSFLSLYFIHTAAQLLPPIVYWQIPIIDFCFRAHSPLIGCLLAAPAPCSPPPPFFLVQCGIFQAQRVLQCWGSKWWCEKEDEKERGRVSTARKRLQKKHCEERSITSFLALNSVEKYQTDQLTQRKQAKSTQKILERTFSLNWLKRTCN